MLAGTPSAAGTVSRPGSPSPQRLPAGVRLAAQPKGKKLGNGVGVPAPAAKLREGREGGLVCPWPLPPAALPAPQATCGPGCPRDGTARGRRGPGPGSGPVLTRCSLKPLLLFTVVCTDRAGQRSGCAEPSVPAEIWFWRDFPRRAFQKYHQVGRCCPKVRFLFRLTRGTLSL